jgi:hypothetical protein
VTNQGVKNTFKWRTKEKSHIEKVSIFGKKLKKKLLVLAQP